MTTYQELVSLVLDELKEKSDDSHFQEEHILFLLDKYRAFILAQRYKDIKKDIPDSNYQTICIDLERANAIDGTPCTGKDYLKSTQKIPNLMTIGKEKVSSIDFFQGNFTYVNNERFKYVGGNRYLQNQIYSTIAPDNHLYLRSNSPQLYYLKKVKFTGIFEDCSKVAELQCPDANGNIPCDVMEMTVPLEESLIPTVTELIIKELGGKLLQPADNENDAADTLDRIANYINGNLRVRRG